MRPSGVFVAFLGVAIVSAVLPVSIGPVVGFWAMLGACVTPLVFAWSDVKGRLKPAPTTDIDDRPHIADAGGAAEAADVVRRRMPAPTTDTDALVTESPQTADPEGSGESRVRLCSVGGLGLASLGWALFVVGKMRMDIVQSGPSFFAAYSDWGAALVRLALLVGVLALVTLLGARGQTRLRGLTSAALLVTWATAEALRS